MGPPKGKGNKRRGPGGPRGPGGGRRGRHPDPPPVSNEDLRAWFSGNLPDDWFTGPVSVIHDRDEIIITGELAQPTIADGDNADIANRARTKAFREDTREHRMAIADRAQDEFERVVSWAVTCGDFEKQFTAASVPVMTRLHFDERATLDTLIDSGVARSRSEAISWAVRLVAENESEWIDQLRAAMSDLEAVRDKGPKSRP